MTFALPKTVFAALAFAAFSAFSPEILAASEPKNADVSDELESKIEDLPGDNFSAPWPKFTKLADMLPAKIVKEEGRENVYETEHFRFTCTAPIALSSLREIARVFEGSYQANLALPLNSPCNYYQVAEKGKLRAVLFETREEFLRAIGGNSTETAKTLGVCLRAGNMETSSILVPFSSLGLEKAGTRYKKSARKINPTTLAHELTHFLSLPGRNYPTWFSEGLAEYVGNTDYNNGKFSFSTNKKEIVAHAGTGRGKNGRNGRGLGKQIKSPPLQKFLAQSSSEFLDGDVQFNYGFSMLLVYYFFHLDGKRDAARIKEFLKACPDASASEKLLDGRTWKQLERDVARGMKSLGFIVDFEK